jgi:hypothetical protein
MTDDLKLREEQKREAAWAPRQRWLAIQATITWAGKQPIVRRNTKARCLELERKKFQALLGD